MTATTLALLASAVGLALFGRRALRWWWGEVMLGLDDPYGEPSAEYEGTTRALKLAPKLIRMVEKAEEPMTVIVTGVEPPPKDGAPDKWGEALRTAARAGADIRHYLPPGTTEEEAAIAQTLADEYPRCRYVRITDTGNGALDVIHPTLAWEGDLMGNDQLRVIAHELLSSLKGNASVDWQHRATARARMRSLVKHILRKYGYPPDLQDAAVQTVLQQAEALSARWASA